MRKKKHCELKFVHKNYAIIGQLGLQQAQNRKRRFSKHVKDCMEAIMESYWRKVQSSHSQFLERITGWLLKDKLNPAGRFELWSSWRDSYEDYNLLPLDV